MHAEAIPSVSTPPHATTPAERNAAAKWTARILAGLVVTFLAWDCSIKLLEHPAAVSGTTSLGFAASLLRPIGIIELACLALYLVPRTAPLGAILFTGYFGGAIATHMRLGNPLWTHQLSPIYFAAMLWIPLYLRDARVRALLAAPRR